MQEEVKTFGRIPLTTIPIVVMYQLLLCKGGVQSLREWNKCKGDSQRVPMLTGCEEIFLSGPFNNMTFYRFHHHIHILSYLLFGEAKKS